MKETVLWQENNDSDSEYLSGPCNDECCSLCRLRACVRNVVWSFTDRGSS